MSLFPLVSPIRNTNKLIRSSALGVHGSPPYTLINADAAGRTGNWVPEPNDVEIHDVRGDEAAFTLDTAGFQFFAGAPDHTSFTDDADIRAKYYSESIALLKLLTGARRVVPFDHTVRRRRPGERDDAPDRRQPVPQVHIDQTAASAAARMHRHLPPADVPALLRRRFQILNLWRPLGHPARDWPLALCDFRSVDRARDVVPITLRYPDHNGETYGVRFAPGHRWWYMRGMRPDEFVLIKCFDSQDDGQTAVFTPHTAFDDPTTPEGAPFRESVELRMLVIY
ncbi:hypothetical protein POSPLADRAFT_1046699 [Postia placenta MAD-698-R-SB12]|uniref:Methyltransferase n=1 Tax=Postia placenta MAD-698-R-SB12 TaxID=670580 RepID=A0A1X6N145_9APHY|nr:hypothetical protein POSPLADRAFT_1046699 [Postia placenta MAD-698-R-SB12]OSX62338.1 hypothetical protein POSPLADRAFT_1046699 [Postia placenta MAD-698-R-SB12]